MDGKYPEPCRRQVEAIDRTGLFAEVLNTLIALKTAIKSAHAKPLGDGVVECSFSMEVDNIDKLKDNCRKNKAR